MQLCGNDKRRKRHDGEEGVHECIPENPLLKATDICTELRHAFCLAWIFSPFAYQQGDYVRSGMGRLSFEDQGLLRILERIQAGRSAAEPSVRIALMRRGLLEPGDGIALSQLGTRVLEELRLRSIDIRRMGEFPVVRTRWLGKRRG